MNAANRLAYAALVDSVPIAAVAIDRPWLAAHPGRRSRVRPATPDEARLACLRAGWPAMLRGARMVTASETEEGRQWAESRVKQITGGDPVTARFMRQDFFTYVPAFKLFIIGNHKPSLRNVDEAARRRFNLVPFTNRPTTKDLQLEEKLRAEWPAILRWMIDGCMMWQREGLSPPASVREATATYFAEQDILGEWMAERCVVDRGNGLRQATTAELFASWSAHAKAANEPAGTERSFSQRLEKAGFGRKDKVPELGGGRARGFIGIAVRRGNEQFEAAE